MPRAPTSSRDGIGYHHRPRNARGAAILRRKSHDMKLHRESIAAGIVLFALACGGGCKKKDKDSDSSTSASEAVSASASVAVTPPPAETATAVASASPDA